MRLPTFRYHPDPLATGMIAPGQVQCACCGRSRDFIYAGPVYAQDELQNRLCPWCIADGSAAAKFDAQFSDDQPLRDDGVPEAVVDEVVLRTPGFISWQQDQWQSHCGDACAFLGDAAPSALRSLTSAAKDQLAQRAHLSAVEWEDFLGTYEPAGDPAVYHFRCLHCGEDVFYMDFS